MEKDFIYKIGEALLLEIKEIEDVTYPKGEAQDKLYISLSGGEKYTLTLIKNK